MDKIKNILGIIVVTGVILIGLTFYPFFITVDENTKKVTCKNLLGIRIDCKKDTQYQGE